MIPFQHGVFATAAGAASGFEAIATVTATGGETSLTFSSIPGTYASLQIRGITRTTYSDTFVNLGMYWNGVTTGYSQHWVFGNGTSALASAGTSGNSVLVGPTTGNNSLPSTYGAMIIDIHDYASTTRNKTARVFCGLEQNSGSTIGQVHMKSGALYNTNAITSLTFYNSDGLGAAFASGTTIALYGVKAAA